MLFELEQRGMTDIHIVHTSLLTCMLHCLIDFSSKTQVQR